MRAVQRSIWSDPLHFIARGFGSGLSPVAPGTMGSVVGLVLFFFFPSAWGWQLLLILAGTLLGFWVCDVTGRDLGEADHESIVWDEIVGMWITLFALPFNATTLLAGFLVFRFFDILKPWPIRLIDERMKNGLGVMLDDIVAGIAANLCLWIGVALYHVV